MQWAFKNGRSSKLRFNFQKSVVLRYPSAPASRSAFNLASAHGYCKIGNKGVFCFSQTVRDDKSPAGFPAELDRLNGFGYRTDLVQFDEYGIRRFFRYAARNQLGIGYIDIIADDLNTRPQRGCMLAKPIPIAFRQTVFNGNDVIFLDPGFVKGRHLGAGFRALVGFGEIVDSVFIERTGGWIHPDNLGGDCRIHIGYGLQDALAVVAFFILIAQFTGFVSPGGRTRWDGCACGYAIIQCYKSAQGGLSCESSISIARTDSIFRLMISPV